MSGKRQRIETATAQYLHLLGSGQSSGLDQFVTKYPEFRDELRLAITNALASQTLDLAATTIPKTIEPTLDLNPNVVQGTAGLAPSASGVDPERTRTLTGDAPTRPIAAKSIEQLPRVFGDYELTRMIAHGGMGVVYEARQTSLGRTVAVKMILAGKFASDRHVQRFYREAKAAGALDHPGIVPVYEVGANDGQHFFSMGFVDGGDLNGQLKDGPLDQLVAASHAKEIAEAISYAHEKGVVHRDLKPGNVLVDRDGKLRLTDFGLATLADGADAMTTDGQVVGTPSYMPPEQATGDIGNVGPLSDVYSIGAVLYCLLTNRPPFQASHPIETLRQVVNAEPVSPRTLNPDVSIDLETICLKCLEKEQSNRYESSAALAEDLRRFLNGEPIHARPVGAPERARKWVRRNKAISALAATTFVALLIGTIVSTVFGLKANQRAINESNAKDAFRIKEAEARKLTGEKSELVLKQAETITELENNLYVSRLRQAQAALDAGDYETAQLLLEEDLPESGQPDRRCFVWRYLYRLVQRADPDVFMRPNSEESARMVSNASGSLVLVISRGEFQVIQTGTMNVVLQKSGSEISDGCFVNDHQVAIAYGRGLDRGVLRATRYQHNGVSVFDFSGAVLEQKINLPSDAKGIDGTADAGVCVAASADGKKLAFGLSDGRVGLWSVDRRKFLGVLKPDDHVSGSKTKDMIRLAFSHDGAHLFSLRYGHAFEIWNLSKRSLTESLFYANRHQYRAHDFPGWLTDRADIAVSDDGKLVAFAGNPGFLSVAVRGEEFRHMLPSDYAITSLDFVPGSHILISGSMDHSICMWDCDTGNQLPKIGAHRAAVGGVVALPAGKVLSFGADDRLRKWNIPKSDSRDALMHGNRVYSLGFQAGTNRLIAAGWQTKNGKYGAGTYDLDSGDFQPLDAPGYQNTSVNGTDITPDGETVATLAYTTSAIEIWNRQLQRSRTIELKDYGYGTGSTVSLHPQGQLVSSKAGGVTRVWDLNTGDVVTSVSGESRFTPDGKLLVSAAEATFFRSVKDNQIGEMQSTTLPTIAKMRFSPDSRLMAAKLRDEPTNFVIVDLQRRCVLFKCNGHYQDVTDLAFSPDKQTLASVSKDKRIIFWDLKTGRIKAEIPAHSTEINCAAFSPDGEQLATGANGAVIRLWHSEVDEERESRLTTRRLNQQTAFERSKTFVDELAAIDFDNSQRFDFTKPTTLETHVREEFEFSSTRFTEDGLRMEAKDGPEAWPKLQGEFPEDFELTATLDQLELPDPGSDYALVSLVIEFQNETKEAFHLELKREPNYSRMQTILGRHRTTLKVSAREMDQESARLDSSDGLQRLRLVRVGDFVHFLHQSVSNKDFRYLGSRKILEPSTDIAHIGLVVKAYRNSTSPKVVWKDLSIRWNGDATAMSPKNLQPQSFVRNEELVRGLITSELPETETIDLSNRQRLVQMKAKNVDSPAFKFTSNGLGMLLEKGGKFARLEIPVQLPGDFDVTATINNLELPLPGSHKIFARLDVRFENDRKDLIGMSCKRQPSNELFFDGCYTFDSKHTGSYIASDAIMEVRPGAQIRLIRSGDVAHYLARIASKAPWKYVGMKELKSIDSADAMVRLWVCSDNSQTISVEWEKVEIRSAHKLR